MKSPVDVEWNEFISSLSREERVDVQAEVYLRKAGMMDDVTREYVMLLHGRTIPMPKRGR